MNKLAYYYHEDYKDFVINLCHKFDLSEKEVLTAINLGADLGLDSLDKIEIMMICEENFNISIPDKEYEETNGNIEAFCNLIYDVIRRKENENVIILSKRAKLHEFPEDFHPTCNLKFNEVHAGMLLLQMWKSDNGKEDWREIPIE